MRTSLRFRRHSFIYLFFWLFIQLLVKIFTSTDMSSISHFRRNLIKKRELERLFHTNPGVVADTLNDASDDHAAVDPDITPDDATDEDWLPERQKKRNRRGKLNSLYIIRQKNIKVEGDKSIYVLLVKMGFKRFLRRKISHVMPMNSSQQATQIVKRCASFIAFNLQTLPSIEHTENGIIQFLAMMTLPPYHKRLQKFLEYLRKEGYKPRTLSHNVDYVISLMEWGIHEIQELDNFTHVPFLEYAGKVRSKVVNNWL